MEFYDRKATFTVEQGSEGVHVTFVSIHIGNRELALESREDFDRLPEREQYHLLEARDTLEAWIAEALNADPPTPSLPARAQVYWADIGGRKRVEVGLARA